MTLLSSTRLTMLYSVGSVRRFAFYRVLRATTADTIDVSTAFLTVLQASFSNGSTSSSCSISGTTLGFAGVAQAGTTFNAWMMVEGETAP